MSTTIDLILSRLPDAKPTGRDRWRCACPVCGERNQSTLSVGVGDTGAVLLKCFKSECTPDQVAHALGLEVSDLFPPRESYGGPLRRRRMLTAQQALDLLASEALVLFVIGSDMLTGKTVNATDWGRLQDAVARVQQLGAEVYA